MKIKRGINQDFSDFDELDDDALDAIEEFQDGSLTIKELQALIGPEAAQAIQDRFNADVDIDSLFDNPEDY